MVKLTKSKRTYNSFSGCFDLFCEFSHDVDLLLHARGDNYLLF